MTDEQLRSLFAGMERHLDQRADAIKERLGKRVDAMGQRMLTGMTARIEALETTLLTEFHKSASLVDARIRDQGATLQALDLELEALKERVQKLEGRVQ
jgi:serine/threonine protein kinase HipA of HipAB toxin-antitoxin module